MTSRALAQRFVLRVLALLTIPALLASATFAQVTFSKAQYGAGRVGGKVVTGDFNRDGYPDIATVDASNLLTIYLNTGSGTFVKKAGYTVSRIDIPVKYDTADLNNDGILDIVVVKEFDPAFNIWLGNGDGTFHFDKSVPTNDWAFDGDFTLADVNHDGNVDLFFVFNGDSSTYGEAYYNDGDENFSRVFGPTIGAFAENWALDDFDGDGKFDVLTRTESDDFSTAQLRLYSGDGAGIFTFTASSPVVPQFGAMTVGSFNRDTALDVAIRYLDCGTGSCTTSSPSRVYFYQNDGTGHFALRSRYVAGVGAGLATAGDLNGDGFQDLWLEDADVINGTAVQAQYLLNHGDGTFSGPFNAGAYDRQSVATIRDINRNGRNDVMAGLSGGTWVFRNTSSAVMCVPPGSATLNVRICGPGDGSVQKTTFTVAAGANSPAGVVKLSLWIDGKKRYELWNDQLKRSVTVSAGRHRVAIVATDRFSTTTTKAVNITAQ
jgi:hypothetical protein